MKTVKHYYNLTPSIYKNAIKGTMCLKTRCGLIRITFKPNIFKEIDLENDGFTRRMENVTCSTCKRHLGI